MIVLGQIVVVIGLTGLLWFGVPTVVTLSSVFASRATGVSVAPEKMAAIRDGFYRVSGSIVVIAAGATLIFLGLRF